MSSNGEVVYGSLFVYAPNKIAPIVFAVLFGLSAAGHFYQCFRYRCFKLAGLQPFCAALFALGYALREVGAYNYSWQTDVEGKINTTNLIIYVLSQVFVFVAPPLLELANYHVLGRILHYIPYMAPISPGRVLSTFGLLMAIVETLNALGVALASNPAGSSQGAGSAMVVTALGMQLVVILVFILLAGIFHHRIARAKLETKPVRIMLYTLYCSMVLILVRSIYRLVEHMGNTEIQLDDLEGLRALTPILRYEWYFYVFEATIMFINSALWNVLNPGRFLPRSPRTYLTRDGVTELMDEQKDDRSLMAKVGAVVSFGCCFRRHENRHFEQLNDYEMSNRGSYRGSRSSHRASLIPRAPNASE
ncbi:RTA1 domain-containing protein [Diaporthe helianthi]|uniref:RTA1 domain-containing protein n=1 Tax=Diaporthe helianthi TaxID=158607 RepID=A0A2P5HYB0_DIAHE|nr:RTA1 domain-containing protein [Diaporthe helianthi]